MEMSSHHEAVALLLDQSCMYVPLEVVLVEAVLLASPLPSKTSINYRIYERGQHQIRKNATGISAMPFLLAIFQCLILVL